MIARAARVALSAGLAWALLSGEARPAEFELYRAQHRPAQELADLIAPLLDPGVAAAADPGTSTVLVRGSPRGILETLQLLRALDQAPRQYRIRSHLTSLTALRARGAEVRGWIRIGDVRIGRLPEGHLPGGDDTQIELRAGIHAATSERELEAELVVMEGRRGEIWTGQAFPVYVRHFEADRRVPQGPPRRRILETTALRPVRQGLAVRPRAAGDEIELELEPIAEELDSSGGIRVIGAQTRVRVRPGEALVIGTLQRERSHDSIDYLGGVEDERGGDDTALVIRATPLQ